MVSNEDRGYLLGHGKPPSFNKPGIRKRERLHAMGPYYVTSNSALYGYIKRLKRIAILYYYRPH